MTPGLTLLRTAAAAADCWNSIGVKGDRSCPELVANVHCQNCPTFAAAARTLLDRPPPEGYLAELTLLSSTSGSQAQQHDTLSVVVFEVSGQFFACDTKAVVEVTQPHPVHRIAHRNSRILSGIVNIHGQLELAVSLKDLLQLGDEAGQASASSAPRMILLEHRAQRWVFAVDAAHGVRRFAPEDVVGVPSTTHHDVSSHVARMLRWGERSVGLLDLDSACAALERSLR